MSENELKPCPLPETLYAVHHPNGPVCTWSFGSCAEEAIQFFLERAGDYSGKGWMDAEKDGYFVMRQQWHPNRRVDTGSIDLSKCVKAIAAWNARAGATPEETPEETPNERNATDGE